MPASKTLPEPSTADPLAHPTLGMRLHAAYLRAGYTRAAFVEALRATDVELATLRYGTVMGWESGAMPGLIALAAASRLVGYSMDNLFHGHGPSRIRNAQKVVIGTQRPKPAPDVKPDDAAITALLDEIGATDEQRDALGEYRQSPAGHYATYTRKFVTEFVRLYSEALGRRRAHPQALIEAARGARSARVMVEALAMGATPLTVSALKKIGADTLAVERKSRVKRKR